MRRRMLDVTAHTTLDFVTARALHPDWQEEASAVVDVDTPGTSGRGRTAEPEERAAGRVRLSVELDASDLTELPRHVDRVELSPAEARALAADLLEAAENAEDADAK